jgi:hypothetical protein
LTDEKGTAKPSEAPAAPRASWLAAGWKRSLLITGVVVVTLGLLVALPAYLASQPSFLTRYPYLSDRYSTWAQSAHKDVPCQACHVPPGLIDQAGYSVRMLGAFYVSLASPEATLPPFVRPTIAACSSCHATLITTSPKGDLKIPHRAHVDVLKVECATCHQYLVHELSPEGRHTPAMAACLTCHDGKQAKNACSTCHTAKAAPESHSASDWVVIHPQEQAKVDCAKCHGWTANWCADCHSRRPTSHVETWRKTHGAAVEVRRDCEACHASSFCTTCHGDVPQTNFDPALKLVQ